MFGSPHFTGERDVLKRRPFPPSDLQNVTVELTRVGDSGCSPCLGDKEVCQLGSLCGSASDRQDLQYEARLK